MKSCGSQSEVLVVTHKLLSELTQDPPDGILAGPKNEENFFEWEALIL